MRPGPVSPAAKCASARTPRGVPRARPGWGATRLLAYHMVQDVGVVMNPMIVAGQLHGGTGRGIGQALFEHTVYDRDGQLLSGSFMDYCIPSAGDLPAPEALVMGTPQPATTSAAILRVWLYPQFTLRM